MDVLNFLLLHQECLKTIQARHEPISWLATAGQSPTMKKLKSFLQKRF